MDSPVVLSCERIVYVWLPYACVCAGVEGVLCMCGCLTRVFARAWKVLTALDCPVRVWFRVCVHAYARMRMRVRVLV